MLELQIHTFAKVVGQEAFSSGSLSNKKAQEGTKKETSGTQEVLKEPQEDSREHLEEDK